jgi:Flp pilus assembly secretin CpaC
MLATRRAALFLAAVLCASTLAPLAAVAQDAPISVKANLARILRISAPAATVIIGNPGIADVTIQDPQTLILTGKSFGTTNLIVLDSQGNPIADTMIEVVQASADVMTVYQGASRTSLSCSPVCQPTLMLGDDPDYSSITLSSSAIIEGAAN